MSGIILPWPAKELSPNARCHRMEKYRAGKSARLTAFWATKEAACPQPSTDCIRLHLTFYPPNKRKRDDDNLIAAFKPFRDGIADALGVDDSRFLTAVDMGEVIKGGRVVARVEAI